MKRIIYKWVFCGLMGWKISGSFDPQIKKCVIIVVPHTSWFDFFTGLLARGIIGLQINWVGKKELFRFPFGYYFRWMGGEPLDRTGGLDSVTQIIGVFKRKDVFRLAIAPEGTRKKVAQWKTGFYYIAVGAAVPIIPVGFDYKHREVIIGSPFYPGGNLGADLPLLEQYFSGVEGKIPQNSVRL